MKEKSTFGKFIIKKRKEKGLTQKELAELLFVTESAVSKWERGVSYPDISLVSDICEVLGITEHELVTASEDVRQREMERQAQKFRNMVKAYAWVFYILYGGGLLACLITNLAVNHRLSWFFIVLTAVLTAFSLTSLPLILKKNRAVWTLATFYVSLNLLLFTCCVYTGGNWFGITFISILFAAVVIFLPFILRALPLPGGLYRHRTLLCFTVDTFLLFLLILGACWYSNTADQFLKTACPITAIGLIFPWILMLVIRYIRLNPLFLTGICCFLTGIYSYLVNGAINGVLEGIPFALPVHNFSRWSDPYIDGNIKLIILISCICMGAVFVVGGIALEVKKQK
ncbi:helix-turn-helix domain-containing protein [Ruminococcus sp. OA3]|uniref:helix-turn-helix domain-containing protein n=1 Tax=Ruminococcus sp. OA3 TaxID=2914164 RepID=UPI001F057511|nr:helix-turn-helix transcriptional regulator [Ruminococcus sp. OA3]MCH1981139.1 helix-turn-helix domain-containing protein [Ruminococcus sp. OA3]